MQVIAVQSNFFSVKGVKGTKAKTLLIKGITEDMEKLSIMEAFKGATDVRIPIDKESGTNRS